MVNRIEALAEIEFAAAFERSFPINQRDRMAAPTFLLILLYLTLCCPATQGQSVARRASPTQPNSGIEVTTQPIETDESDEIVRARRAIAALRRLQNDVLIYRSLGDFEATGKLARVSFETFQNDLQQVISEVEPTLSGSSQNKVTIEVSNALSSFCDGGFWWAKIRQSRVVNISTANFHHNTTAPRRRRFNGHSSLYCSHSLASGDQISGTR
jgi:hypothetical protein